MSENKNIRIKDIAEMAGVSVGTVDRVIHKRGKVAEEVRKKVEDVIQSTGYKPNLLARTLGSKKAVHLALLIPNPQQDEYWALAESGVAHSLDEWSQYGLEITPHFFDLYDSKSFAVCAQNVLSSQPDGVIVAPIFHHESLNLFATLKTQKTPYVLFNTNIPEAQPLSFIGQDLYQSGKVGGELLSLSHSDKKGIAVFHIHESVDNSVHLKAKEMGLRDQLGSAYDISSHDLNHVNSSELNQIVSQILQAPDLGGVFVSTSQGTNLIAALMEKHGHTDIKLVGYDLLADNLRYLEQGVINFLINQNPKRMTQVGISHLTNHLLFHKELPREELFPLEIISKQNVASYLNSRIH
ncbi:hypothetical protein BFP72_00470 [Reichenbachiella sp. 5M10]|uniref:substrate-binding domain-containing protein n=1 Tax=Reichenbachiella sp. 5M10 TaxID=1889772 RepID=UPI000C14861C|nr:LacI family DNA-binding transcriptional regulator [Reichenbachiella sp. 5M10]PIB34011.1 hypothetical protein BFP72_00470 [Reichenbachiella sp. 5M10]